MTEKQFQQGLEKEYGIFPKPQDIGDLIDLELSFPLNVEYRLFDTFDDKAITKHEEGYLVKLTLPENDWLYNLLMSFGHKVTIIRPPSLRQTIANKHEIAINHHKGV